MATVKEEFELLKAKILAGKENETVHVVWVDQDRKRRIENKPREGGKRQQRFVLDCGSPEAYSEVYAEWDRLLTQVGNKTVAVSILIDWLRALTEKRIAKKLEDGSDIAADAPAGPPKAQLPKWMQP